jgi:hypothetical protein
VPCVGGQPPWLHSHLTRCWRNHHYGVFEVGSCPLSRFRDTERSVIPSSFSGLAQYIRQTVAIRLDSLVMAGTAGQTHGTRIAGMAMISTVWEDLDVDGNGALGYMFSQHRWASKHAAIMNPCSAIEPRCGGSLFLTGIRYRRKPFVKPIGVVSISG